MEKLFARGVVIGLIIALFIYALLWINSTNKPDKSEQLEEAKKMKKYWSNRIKELK